MATNPIRRYHLSKLPERQTRSDTFPESHRISSLPLTPYMLNLGLLPSLPQIDHELMVVFHHKKAPP